MFDLYEKKQKRQDFIQEYVYVEDYSLYQPQKKKEKDENPRGMVEVDLNNGKTTEIT